MLSLTKEMIKEDFDTLPENYKTKDVDRLISHYVKEHADVSNLKDYILEQPQLIAELAIYEPDTVLNWMKTNGFKYNINGKAIQKICDSFRITDEWKKRFKDLRQGLKNNLL